MISGIGLYENNVTDYPGSEIVYIRLVHTTSAFSWKAKDEILVPQEISRPKIRDLVPQVCQHLS